MGAAASIVVFDRSPGWSADPALIVAVTAVILVVGLLSCGAPALRALRIEPTIAMKDDV